MAFQSAIATLRHRLTGPALLALLRSEKMTNTVLYLAASAFGAAISIITLPLFTKQLTPADFGIVGYVTSINGFLVSLFTLRLESFYNREYFVKPDPKYRKQLLSTLLSFTVGWTVLLIVLLTIIGAITFSVMDVKVPFFPFMFVVLAGNLGLGTFTYATLRYRIQERAWGFAVLTVLQAALQTGIALFLVLNLHQGVLGRLVGLSAGTVITGVVALAVVWRTVDWRVDNELLRKAIKFGLPLIPAGLAAQLFDTIDRVFLERLSTMTELGYYNVAMQYGGTINILALSLYRAFEPSYYAMAADRNYRKMGRAFILITALFGGSALLLIGASGFVIDALTHGKFGPSVQLSRVLLVSFFLKAEYLLGAVLLVTLGRTKQMMYNSVGGLVVYAIASYWFLIWFGVIGAAWAKLIPVAAMLIAAVAQSGQAQHFRWMMAFTGLVVFVLTAVVLLLG
jgi:O-antigen/teichoic acid export membrane protein